MVSIWSYENTAVFVIPPVLKTKSRSGNKISDISAEISEIGGDRKDISTEISFVRFFPIFSDISR